MAAAPIIIGYDGSTAADRAVDAAAELFKPRPALVVSVWEPGQAWESVTTSLAITPIPIDFRLALDLEEGLYEGAQNTARRGAERAAAGGLEAEPLVVGDRISVADTLVRLAKERNAAAIAVGSHGHWALAEALFGSTAGDVLKSAPCPTLVVRAPEE